MDFGARTPQLVTGTTLKGAILASGHGQQRIVTDHLGSTTLVVDTSNPPAVLQRQYHKPYGESAWQYTPPTQGSLTNVAYTGQRTDEDSTGLMFYNARMYDPALSSFVSADNIGADGSDPLTRNKYGYTLYNPIRYTDPTGHCADQDKNGVCHDQENEARERSEIAAELANYGLDLTSPNMWSLGQLRRLLSAIDKMMSAFGWTTYDEFKTAMGIDSSGRIDVELEVDGKGGGYGGLYTSGPDGRVITIYDTAVEYDPNNPNDLGMNFVHELAHAWDAAYDWRLSNGMLGVTGGKETPSYYYAGGIAASEYGGSGPSGIPHNAKEDWAEAVAGYVYPEESKYSGNARYNQRTGETEVGMDANRRRFVEKQAHLVTSIAATHSRLPKR